MSFPSSLPNYAGFTPTETLAVAQHGEQHNAEQADIIAIATKVGTGSSTPIQNTVLRGSGTGTTTYDQVHAASDISGILSVSNGGSGTNTSTGSGSVVLNVGPTLTNNIDNNGTYNNPTLNSIPINSIPATAIVNNSITSSQLANGAVTATNIGTDSSFAFVDYSASSTIVGWTSFTIKVIKYFRLGKLVWVLFDLAGTSNSTSVSFTLPQSQQGTPASVEAALGLASDNGSAVATTGRLSLSSNVVQVFAGNPGTGWTASGTKEVRGQFFFEAT